MKFTLYIGFFAGVIWGFFKIIAYYIGFTKVIPAYIADPFFKRDYLTSWTGHLIGWGFFILFSILAAGLYMLLFHRVKGPWMGIVFGVAIWLLIFGWPGPWLGTSKYFTQLDLNSNVTEICLLIMWGLFIGYSIAFEFTEERVREPFYDHE